MFLNEMVRLGFSYPLGTRRKKNRTTQGPTLQQDQVRASACSPCWRCSCSAPRLVPTQSNLFSCPAASGSTENPAPLTVKAHSMCWWLRDSGMEHDYLDDTRDCLFLKLARARQLGTWSFGRLEEAVRYAGTCRRHLDWSKRTTISRIDDGQQDAHHSSWPAIGNWQFRNSLIMGNIASWEWLTEGVVLSGKQWPELKGTEKSARRTRRR